MALILETVSFIGKGWIRHGDREWLLLGDSPGWRQSPREGSPGSVVDEVGLIVEFFDLSVIGVDEINNLLDRGKALLFLLDECMDHRVLAVVHKEHTRW